MVYKLGSMWKNKMLLNALTRIFNDLSVGRKLDEPKLNYSNQRIYLAAVT